MSCEFCKKCDFTAVAVKDNDIHLAGGNTNFVECATKYPEIKLFQFCPLCGSPLLYGAVASEANVTAPKTDTVRVALDMYGNRIDYAIYDTDTTMSKEAYDIIRQLAADTGCRFEICKDAYYYAKSRDGDYGMMVAYCKAKIYAVKTSVPFDKRVDKFLEDMNAIKY